MGLGFPAHPHDLPTFNNMKAEFSTYELHLQDLTFGYECHSLCESALLKNFNLSTSDYIRNKRCNERRSKYHPTLMPSWRNITDKCNKSCFKKTGFSFQIENEWERTENENCENDINEED